MSVGVHCMLRIKTDDILYTPLPLYHTAGGMTGVGQVLLHGASLAIRSKFSASNFWADCVTYGCTVSVFTLQYLREIENACRILVIKTVGIWIWGRLNVLVRWWMLQYYVWENLKFDCQPRDWVFKLNFLWGHAMMHVVSHWSFPVEAWLQVPTSAHGVCGQGGNGTSFSPSTSLFPVITLMPCAPTFLCHRCYIISAIVGLVK